LWFVNVPIPIQSVITLTIKAGLVLEYDYIKESSAMSRISCIIK